MNVPMGLENLSLTREYDAWLSAGDAQERAEERMTDQFLMLAAKCDASAPAPWAPQVTDWLNGGKGKRAQILSECMSEALECMDDGTTALMQLLLDVAAGAERKEQAQQMVNRMAARFASLNAEGDE